MYILRISSRELFNALLNTAETAEHVLQVCRVQPFLSLKPVPNLDYRAVWHMHPEVWVATRRHTHEDHLDPSGGLFGFPVEQDMGEPGVRLEILLADGGRVTVRSRLNADQYPLARVELERDEGW